MTTATRTTRGKMRTMKKPKNKPELHEIDPKPEMPGAEVEPIPPIEDKSKPKKEPKAVEIDIKTDDNFSEDEQKEILEMIKQDESADSKVMSEWLDNCNLGINHYQCEKPSILENLKKASWMADRNLGLCPAVVDQYQSILLATCWNPETIHYTPSGDNAFDNRDNLERFTKWAVGQNEMNLEPEIDDYIHTKETQGFSCFKIGWNVSYQWVDKRIWNEKKKTYDIKTEKMRFERGSIENINNLEDLLMPRYGSNIQYLPHIIHIIHKYGWELLEMSDNKEVMNVDEKWIKTAKEISLAKRRQKTSKTERAKAEQLGISDVTDDELRSLPVDIHVWYGEYEKNGKRERYRFMVDLGSSTFLAGKPLRKINRAGKYPFVGGAFIRRPGFIKGQSLPLLIAPIVNAFNNIFNQVSDSQYVSNCPFGFFKPDEAYQQQKYDLVPGILYPTDDPKSIVFPNLQRSSAWAESHIRILFELLEKLTGASQYFRSHKETNKQTQAREQNKTERFSLWVSRIQNEICEAITMAIQLYQDWAPPKLGERVLGEDGRKIIQSLSIESLRGNYAARMEPDITAGSKAYQMQSLMWAFENLQKSMWFDPRVNPKGNYELTEDVIKGMGLSTRYMPPKPKANKADGQDIKDEWRRFIQGEKFHPPEGASQAAMAHLEGHLKQKEEKCDEIDEEYRSSFDQHIFETRANVAKFMAQVQQEKHAEALAMNMMAMHQQLGVGPEKLGMPQPEGQEQPPAQPQQPQQPPQMMPQNEPQWNQGGAPNAG